MGDLSERPQARTRQDPAYKQMPWLPQKKRDPGAGQEEVRRLSAVERLERKDRKGNFEDKSVRLQVLQILQQNAKRKQRSNLQLYRNHRTPKALSSGKLPGSRRLSGEAEIMAMKVDAAKARKALYGITMGMTNHELVQYSGYGVNTVRLIRKNPEKYKKAIQEQEKRDQEKKRTKREYVSTFKEEFALEWEETTNWIKKYADWKK